MSAKNLQQFLQNLEMDPALKRAYLANPVEVMTAQGVDATHQKMLLAGDESGLNAVLQTLGGSSAVTAITAALGLE